jgi:hypothetical protein
MRELFKSPRRLVECFSEYVKDKMKRAKSGSRGEVS